MCDGGGGGDRVGNRDDHLKGGPPIGDQGDLILVRWRLPLIILHFGVEKLSENGMRPCQGFCCKHSFLFSLA